MAANRSAPLKNEVRGTEAKGEVPQEFADGASTARLLAIAACFF